MNFFFDLPATPAVLPVESHLLFDTHVVPTLNGTDVPNPPPTKPK